MTTGDPAEEESRFLIAFPDSPPRISRIQAGTLVRAHHKNGHALKHLKHAGASPSRPRWPVKFPHPWPLQIPPPR
jgi:hypothetical protein